MLFAQGRRRNSNVAAGRPKGVEVKYSLKIRCITTSDILGVQFSLYLIMEKRASSSWQERWKFYCEKFTFYLWRGGRCCFWKLAGLGDIYVNDAWYSTPSTHFDNHDNSVFPNWKMFRTFIAKKLRVWMGFKKKKGEKPVTAVLGGSKLSSSCNQYSR
jgi:phosphoglycerate kinase